MMKYCVGFFIKNEAVVLIEKKRPKWQEGKLNGIGGKLIANELPVQAMIREFKEEASLQTIEFDWDLKLELINKERIVFFFIYTGNAKFEELKTETDEQLRFIILSGLSFCNVIPNLKWIIPLIQDKTLKFPIKIENSYEN